ncbi:MAG: tRNA dihydrouridine synthase DusB [bacterium]
MQIGPYTLDSPVVLAPMAGVTDRPFRLLCRELGAGMAVSEMISSDLSLWNSSKSRLRMDHRGEPSPRSVQIAGTEPVEMAEAARINADQGAQIIDINMGCPAKKVCRKAAGSALLQNERLVASIVEAVVKAVDIPVTLKIRTGWDRNNRNGVTIARIAEDAGIQALAVHGRTRACGYTGQAEYDTIAHIKQAVSIPILANGDITNPHKAVEVLKRTGVDAVMVGRGAQGNPWIFQQINHYLEHQELPPPPNQEQKLALIERHIRDVHNFYTGIKGVRVARKHIGWYLSKENIPKEKIKLIFKEDDANDQLLAISKLYNKHQGNTHRGETHHEPS